jgi:hypothetical protein
MMYLHAGGERQIILPMDTTSSPSVGTDECEQKTGVTKEELRSRSFVKILDGRRGK